MKTKAEIVQKLLEDRKIDAEEAITLLLGDKKEIQFIPYPVYPQPYYPLNPYPYFPNTPIWQIPNTICGVTNTASGGNLPITHTVTLN